MERSIPERIKKYNTGRQEHALQLKYAAMAENSFRFFRGTCHLFYEDLLPSYQLPASPLAWICGDLHIENFGSYRGENRLLYFDINDFDESQKAPLLYDISRLLVSVELATLEIGLSKKEATLFIQQLLRSYRQTLIKGKSFVIEKETASGLIKKLVRKVDKRKKQALLIERTTNKTGGATLLQNEKLQALPKNEKKELTEAFSEWFNRDKEEKYIVTDAGYRITGTGSIGVKRYCLLLENESNTRRKKLIDIKEALSPAALTFSKEPQPFWDSEAHRIISIQNKMQHVPPAFLSAFEYKNSWYVVKELQPADDKINISRAANRPRHIEKYYADLGVLTASAQLRSSGILKSATADELREFAERNDWTEVLLEWSSQYMRQMLAYYKEFYTAWKDNYFNT